MDTEEKRNKEHWVTSRYRSRREVISTDGGVTSEVVENQENFVSSSVPKRSEFQNLGPVGIKQNSCIDCRKFLNF